MINLPSSLAKGENLTFALNKSLVIAAVSDSYWSDAANISKCVVVYKSTSGHQRKRLEFDFSQESPTVIAEWSAKARNDFEIEEIVLIDFDSGSYTIPRASLPSGKGISFAGESGGGGGSIVVEVVHNYIPNGAINDMVADGNSLYIGGAFTTIRFHAGYAAEIDPTTAANLEKDQSAGKWPAFNGKITKIAMDGADAMFVIGDFTTMNGEARQHVARLIRSGSAWVSDTAFNIVGRNQPSGAGYPPNDVLVHGNHVFFVTSGTGWRQSDGTLVNHYGFIAINKSTFATVASGYGATSGVTFYTLAVDDSHVYYGGFLSIASPTGRIFRRSLLSPTLALDTAFSYTLPNTGVNDIQIVGNDLYLAGSFTNYSTGYYIAKISKLTGQIDTGFVSPITANHATGRLIWSILVDGDFIYAGGTMPQLGKNLVKLNRFTGALVSGFDSGTACSISSGTAVVYNVIKSGDNVVAVGSFDGRTSTAQEISCRNIVKVNASTGAIISEFSSKDSLIATTEPIHWAHFGQSECYVFGDFTGYGGYSRQGVAKLNKDSYGNWKVDETFDSSNGATGLVWTLLKDGEWLYVGGDITAYAGQTRNRVARVNASTGALDTSFGVGVFTTGLTTGQFNGVLGSAPVAGTGVVNKIVKNGSLIYIAGSFTTYSKKNSSGAAASVAAGGRWIIVDPATNTETVPANGANNHIYEMIVDGNSVYFGGNFTSWGGVTRNHLVKVNSTDFAVDSTFTSPVNSNAFVDLLSLVNGELWAGVQGSSSLLRINKSTGALLNSYVISTTGGSNIRVRGGIFEDSTYVYVLMSRISSTYFQEIRRISKATNTIDSSWGYKTTGNNNVWMSAVMVGDEFIIGGFPNTTTTAFNLTYKKDLWIIDKTTASQKFNI